MMALLAIPGGQGKWHQAPGAEWMMDTGGPNTTLPVHLITERLSFLFLN